MIQLRRNEKGQIEKGEYVAHFLKSDLFNGFKGNVLKCAVLVMDAGRFAVMAYNNESFYKVFEDEEHLNQNFEEIGYDQYVLIKQ